MFFARVPILAPPWLTVAAFLATLGPGSASLGVAAAAAAEPAPAPLRLVGTAGDVEYDQFVVEDHELFVRTADGAKQPVPRSMKWRLEGDLRANGELVSFSPGYFLDVRGNRPVDPQMRTRTFASVLVERGGQWETEQLSGGIAVVVWLSAAQPVRVMPVAVRLTKGASWEIAALAAFELPAGMEDGAPVVLLWKEGAFLAPRPWFGDAKSQTVLHEVYFGKQEDVRNAGASLKRMDVRSVDSRRSLLHFAARDGRLEAVAALLELGADPNLRDADDRTALHLAAQQGRADVLRTLLAAGAKPVPLDAERRSPMELALDSGHLTIVRGLFIGNPRAATVSKAWKAALDQVDEDLIHLLLEKKTGRQLRAFDPESFAAAVQTINPDLAIALRNAGARVAEDRTSVKTAPVAPLVDVDIPAILQNGPSPEPVFESASKSDSFPVTQATATVDPISGEVRQHAATHPGMTSLVATVATGQMATVTLTVEADGTTSSVQIVRAVPDALSAAVEKVIGDFRFLPAEKSGVPVRSRTTLAIRARDD